MPDPLLRLALFLAICLAVGMVSGATRASTLVGVTRRTLRNFVGLAGGIALLVLAMTLVESVVRGQ
jgi:hypothetical protein